MLDENGIFADLFTGNLAEIAMWSVTLTDAEIAALATGVRPNRVRPAAVVGYWPLWGVSSPEPDVSGNGYTLTLVGSPPQANHAPVALLSSPRRLPNILPSSYQSALSETVSLADGRGMGPAPVAVETYSVSDLRALLAAPALAETASLNDLRAVNAAPLDLETLSLTNLRAMAAGAARSEPLPLTDNRSMTAAPVDLETLALPDTRMLTAAPVAVETLSLADARAAKTEPLLPESAIRN